MTVSSYDPLPRIPAASAVLDSVRMGKQSVCLPVLSFCVAGLAWRPARRVGSSPSLTTRRHARGRPRIRSRPIRDTRKQSETIGAFSAESPASRHNLCGSRRDVKWREICSIAPFLESIPGRGVITLSFVILYCQTVRYSSYVGMETSRSGFGLRLMWRCVQHLPLSSEPTGAAPASVPLRRGDLRGAARGTRLTRAARRSPAARRPRVGSRTTRTRRAGVLPVWEPTNRRHFF